jgi:hypothetical protein
MTFERGLTPGVAWVRWCRSPSEGAAVYAVNEENVRGYIGLESSKSLPGLGFASRVFQASQLPDVFRSQGGFVALVAAALSAAAIALTGSAATAPSPWRCASQRGSL